MPLLCIDIGNTHTHYGVVNPDGSVREQGVVVTTFLDDPQEGLPARLNALFRAPSQIEGIAFCSVVPVLNRRLRDVLAAATTLPVFQLTHECQLGVAITYPKPAEIGQDRLANAAAAHALGGSPAIVIDSGTAVTFDIITQKGGYEGGIIAPGLELTRRYLHERTAQLPLLDDSLEIKGMIGKSTSEAMRIGTVVGFPGLIQALLDGVLAELTGRGEKPPHIFITGGNAAFLQSRLRQPVSMVPDLTLIGLAAARRLNTI
ncbi:type III pantothenate kinase [Rariglobus hedericola]|uniref:Type III pantothenate kinase n=1 Tax=Rariglobus hedericola TaxID=2597822 RepID=A0A556QR27_9BACT|nr:type III pantothenate kinase [Rariglobus hedericola]TSJ79094.1 type III pantothenate kinase [Rariglobus hedericola]